MGKREGVRAPPILSSPRRLRRTAPVPRRADERHLRPSAKPDGERGQAAPAWAQAQPARRSQERARVLHAGQLPRAQQSEPPHLGGKHAVRQHSACSNLLGPRKRCSSDTQTRTPGGLAQLAPAQAFAAQRPRLLCAQDQAGSPRACARAVRACHRPPPPIGQAARLRAGEARRRRRGDRAGAGRAAARGSRGARGVAAAELLQPPCQPRPWRPPPRPQPGTATQPGGVPGAATGGAGDGGGLTSARQVRRRGPTVPLGCRCGVHLSRVGVSARVDVPPEERRSRRGGGG